MEKLCIILQKTLLLDVDIWLRLSDKVLTVLWFSSFIKVILVQNWTKWTFRKISKYFLQLLDKLTNVSGGEINYLLLITYSVRFDRMLTRKINLLLAKTLIYSLSSPMLNRFFIKCYQHLIFEKLLFSFAAYLSYNQIIEKLSVNYSPYWAVNFNNLLSTIWIGRIIWFILTHYCLAFFSSNFEM